MTKRTSSAKLLFYDITGEGAKVQIMADLGCGFRHCATWVIPHRVSLHKSRLSVLRQNFPALTLLLSTDA